MIVLDTSVLSAALFKRRLSSGQERAVDQLREWISRDVSLGLPGIVLQELLSAPRDARGVRAVHLALAGYPLLLAGRREHEQAAEIRRTCAAAGVPTGTADSLIAAQASTRGRRLFTLDEDFRAIARVTGLALA